MGWMYLVLAILFEVSGTISMKFSKGFTQTLPSILIFLFYGASFYFLTHAIRFIEISVVYAVWSGVGITLIAIVGVLWFQESINAVKILSLLLVILGIIGLQFSSQPVPSGPGPDQPKLGDS